MKGGWWALERSIEEEAEGAIDAKDEVVKGKAKDAGDGEADWQRGPVRLTRD